MAILFPVDQCDLQKVPVLFYSPELWEGERCVELWDTKTVRQLFKSSQPTHPPMHVSPLSTQDPI